MDFAFSDEQEELRRTVRGFLADKSPETEVRRLMETTEGYDPKLWQQMGEQLGLQGLAIPEEYGGAGFTFLELGVVLEEMGRALLCAPYFATTVLAANTLLLSSDEEAKQEYLPGLASGESIGTLALSEEDGRWDAQGVKLAADNSGGAWTLTGTKMFVLDGAVADLILVAARIEDSGQGADGISIFAVSGDAEGLTRTSLATLDQTRKQARLTFDNVEARLIDCEGGGWPVISQVLDLAAVALAAEQVGGAARVLEMSVEYAKVRVQFGRP
ncbi:MAG: acyl-CoA dehydrogenase protein, partial [Mycobacterium sp.]|nr:acyl-CoA dehydrogenase protein [Mycobacterium sp.]